ncbi:ElaA protein [Roseateles sp. YR242]|uniref:GNAT family N-acetyltransferase n=1 Tax=Roseateles sp. YR242 TaxID=1855305 RepID=UPI0008CFDBE4|nr:GNAT family N-acetyltransferase [Roseateles sp. YR242]SEL00738.1 ElaA protein [Roseateles sp. YR242]
MVALSWRCEVLDALTPRSLYRLMKLRSEVFVVEQRCAYLDPDGLDEEAWHLQALDEGGALLAYARLLAPGAAHGSGDSPGNHDGHQSKVARIGRVIIAPAARGTGMGRELMRQALAGCERLWPGAPIELGAQAHLRAFYGSFGFQPISEVYDEDGIPHVDMRREAAG